MQATKVLPMAYEQRAELDGTKNRFFIVGVNVVGLVVMVLFGWLAWRFLHAVHPATSPLACLYDVTGRTTGLVARLIVLVVALTFILFVGSLHEIVHGVFFWLFTGERPALGFRSLYLYAGAPDWYLPRNQHLIVSLAPFLSITLVGGLLAFLASGSVAVWALVAVVSNAAGAVGDFVWVIWLLRQPPQALVRDQGDVLTAFHPVQHGIDDA